MNCKEAQGKINFFLDRQLDEPEMNLVQEHLNNCRICPEILEKEKKWETVIQGSLHRMVAPKSLKESILKKISQAEEKESTPVSFFFLSPFRPAFTFVFFLVALATLLMFRPSEPFPMFIESIADHKKFLRGQEALQITTDDPKLVRTWFQGKLPFDVQAPDLLNAGVRLLGGKKCSIGGMPTAFLIYQKDGTTISAIAINVAGLTIPPARVIDTPERLLYATNESGLQSVLRLEKTGTIGWIFVSSLPEETLLKILK